MFWLMLLTWLMACRDKEGEITPSLLGTLENQYDDIYLHIVAAFDHSIDKALYWTTDDMGHSAYASEDWDQLFNRLHAQYRKGE